MHSSVVVPNGRGDARNLTGRELQALLALSQFALELIRVAGSAKLLDALFRLGESGSEILVSALELGALAMAAQAELDRSSNQRVAYRERGGSGRTR